MPDFYYTDRKRFSNKHYMFGHATYYTTLSDLRTLYKCCDTCMIGITIPNYTPPSNLNLLICKSQTDYHTECCGCTTVTECRAKHNCCCETVLEDEIEKKKKQELENEAKSIVEKKPELAELICRTKSGDIPIFDDVSFLESLENKTHE